MELYSFGFNFHLLDLSKCLFLVFPICLWLFAGSLEKKFIRILLSVFSVSIGLIIVVVFYIGPVCNFFEIKNRFENGQISVVEGEVSDFSSPENPDFGHDCESFSVDGIVFSYHGTESYGYSRFRSDNGVVKGNGQKLRIEYCYDSFSNTNVICRISQLE